MMNPKAGQRLKADLDALDLIQDDAPGEKATYARVLPPISRPEVSSPEIYPPPA